MGKISIKNMFFFRILRFFFGLSGLIFIAAVILALTTLPYRGIHWLGTSKAQRTTTPAAIILLGGGGMPSESNLMRSWYTEKAARNYPEAQVIIAMPGDLTDNLSTPRLMQEELELRGITTSKISFEYQGTNTRGQALHCAALLDTSLPILLITSPEHTRRAVLSFKKAEFKQVNALPAFENAPRANLLFRDDELGGRKTLTPDVGENMQIRYQVWNHLKYEITFAREMLALGYYKLRGWI
jgi:uncharacterized SAM-binding protein YcdF (DUF218 family)